MELREPMDICLAVVRRPSSGMCMHRPARALFTTRCVAGVGDGRGGLTGGQICEIPKELMMEVLLSGEDEGERDQDSDE